MAVYGRARLGGERYGHVYYPPTPAEYRNYGSVGAGTATTSADAAANNDPCPDGLPQTARIFRSLLDASTSTYLLDTSGYVITGGQIVEDIREVPYAQGTIELDGRSQLDVLAIKTLVENGTFRVYIQENLQFPFAGGVEQPHIMGTFIVQSVDLDSEKGSTRMSLKVFAEANGILGPTVSGDLSSAALGIASSLGLTAALVGGPTRASIEGIAAYILDQGGRTVTVAPGIAPRPAYTGFFDDNGTIRTIGPFNISPAMGAAQVLGMCRWMAGIHILSQTDGTAILSPMPTGAAEDLAPPVRTYGYEPCFYPAASVRPLPREIPASVRVTNQSAASAPRSVTVAIPGGTGADLTHNFASYAPASLDADDAQTYRANSLAYQLLQEGNQVEVKPMADAQVHAGDIVELIFNSHGVPTGFYQVARATHPVGAEPTCTLLCESLSLSLAA